MFRIIFVLTFIFLIGTLSLVIANESSENVKKQVGTPEQIELYSKECGSCHNQFKPDLLPKHTWKRMMNTLETHFGTDAFLEEEDRIVVEGYLFDNAGKKCVITDVKKIENMPVIIRHEEKSISFLDKMLNSITTKEHTIKVVDPCDYKHYINSNRNLASGKKRYCANCHIEY